MSISIILKEKHFNYFKYFFRLDLKNERKKRGKGKGEREARQERERWDLVNGERKKRKARPTTPDVGAITTTIPKRGKFTTRRR